MRYSQLAALPALFAVAAYAAPQAVEVVNVADVVEGPVRVTDIEAQASHVLAIMADNKPSGLHTAVVTVTGPAATVATVKKTTTIKRKTTTKKAKKIVKKVKKVAKRAATTPATTTSSTATVNVNTGCAPQPVYQTYLPAVNNASGFLTDATIGSNANNAVTPAGYSWTFANFAYSINKNGFLGVYEQTSYNVSQCAATCSSTAYCEGFNIFYERDPTLAPAAACLNPTSQVAIKCTLWTSAATVASAINYGEWRANFQVLVYGSNGYSSTS